MALLHLRWALLLPFLAFSALAQSVTLSQFQQISGFPQACTQAYNTPIQGCTAKDFTASNVCSQSCIDGLDNIQVLLNSACKGVTASTNTLIGLFFAQKGVQALCPQGSSGGETTATLQPSTIPAAPTSSLPQSTLQVTTTPVQPPLPQSSSSTIQSSSAQTSQAPSSSMVTANPDQTTPPSTQSASSPLPSFTLSSDLSSTSSSQSTTSTANPNDFGGSVNPFGSSSNAASTMTFSGMLLAGLVAGAASFALLI